MEEHKIMCKDILMSSICSSYKLNDLFPSLVLQHWSPSHIEITQVNSLFTKTKF